ERGGVVVEVLEDVEEDHRVEDTAHRQGLRGSFEHLREAALPAEAYPEGGGVHAPGVVPAPGCLQEEPRSAADIEELRAGLQVPLENGEHDLASCPEPPVGPLYAREL